MDLFDSPSSDPPPSPEAAKKILARLDRSIQVCRECPIGEFATQGVAGEGPVRASLMLVGEQPGNDEDLAGRPFVGPAGRLLDRAFADLGWPRERLYVSNAVKHFKFELRGKRRIHKTPAQREVTACHHWLEDEIAAVAPQALVALGATALRSLVGGRASVMRDRGNWVEGPNRIPVLVTLHPSAILRAERDGAEAAYRDWVADLKVADRYGRGKG